jgi:hypothetical protein
VHKPQAPVHLMQSFGDDDNTNKNTFKSVPIAQRQLNSVNSNDDMQFDFDYDKNARKLDQKPVPLNAIRVAPPRTPHGSGFIRPDYGSVFFACLFFINLYIILQVFVHEMSDHHDFQFLNNYIHRWTIIVTIIIMSNNIMDILHDNNNNKSDKNVQHAVKSSRRVNVR